jgi:Ca2+-dependent lipid-binding protein
MVPSRVEANFMFEVADWNQVGTSTPLGKNVLDLASLEPFESTELNVPVNHEKGPKGHLHLRLLFQPESESRPSRLADPSHRAVSKKN